MHVIRMYVLYTTYLAAVGSTRCTEPVQLQVIVEARQLTAIDDRLDGCLLSWQHIMISAADAASIKQAAPLRSSAAIVVQISSGPYVVTWFTLSCTI